MVCKPNLVKCFGPRLRLWTWTLDFVPGPSFSKKLFLCDIYDAKILFMEYIKLAFLYSISEGVQKSVMLQRFWYNDC